MKMHFLWTLLWLYACGAAQSQTGNTRLLKVEGSKLADTPLLLDGSRDVLVSIGRGLKLRDEPPGAAPWEIDSAGSRYDYKNTPNICMLLLAMPRPRREPDR
jgi:hypothetical protein